MVKKLLSPVFVFFVTIWFCCAFSFSCLNSGNNSTYQPGFAKDSSEMKVIQYGMPSLTHYQNAQQLVQYMNDSLKDTRVNLVPCLNFEDYMNKLEKGYFDLITINGLIALDAEKNNYRIIGRVGDDLDYRTVIFTRKYSDIRKISDLENKKIALPEDRRILAKMQGLYYLYNKGLDVNNKISQVNVSSYESSIMSVYLEQAEAGICLLRSWDNYKRTNPRVMEKLQANWITDSLPDMALAVNERIDTNTQKMLLKILSNADKDSAGREALKIMGIGKFTVADKNYFLPLLDFRKKYESVIH